MSTIYEQMLEAVKYYEANQPLKKVTTTVYKDIATQTELTTDAELLAAFKGGKSISDFEVVTEVVDPKKDLNELIFGEEKPKSLQLVKFFRIIEELTGLTAPEIATDEPKETKGKSDYAKKYSALKAAIRSAEEKKDEVKKAEKIGEIVQLVIDNGKPPKGKFLYMAEYEAAIAAKAVVGDEAGKIVAIKSTE